MRYILLLWPHANARYQAESRRLAEAELRLMLRALAPEAEIDAGVELAEGLPCLAIDAPAPLSEDVLCALRRHSLLYGLFREEGGALLPLCGRAETYLGADLPAVLKYKGKTNEMFLMLLVNAALYSGDFWRQEGPLALLDPMCGRGTGLFVAANLGWNAVGADVDRSDLKEAERYFKRYLEYHRYKHAASRESRTLKKGPAADVSVFDYADTPEHYRDGSTLRLSLACLDAADVAAAFGRSAFHVVACDLPYGVRHDAQLPRGAKGKNWLEALLKQALPAWREALKPGGTVAVSFNAQTFKLEALRALMAGAGLEPMEGGPYDGFSHWVEQAITRDIAIARKPK